MYERDYISDMNSRVTLLGDSMIGIGFLPYEANENRLFYLRKYDSLEVMENTAHPKRAGTGIWIKITRGGFYAF